MFADIALHRRMPNQFDTFTYQIPAGFALREGQFVRVPFRKQILSGVVRKIHYEEPPYATKLIAETAPLLLTPTQLHLAEWMSAFYKCPFSKVIDLFVPEKVWPLQKSRSKKEKKILTEGAHVPSLQNGHTEVLKSFVQRLLKTPTKKLIIEEIPLPREAFYRHLITSLPPKTQTLFIFPELFHLKKFADDSPLFHGGLSEIKKSLIWHAVRQEKLQIMKGTRTALFLPFQKLSCVVVDFENSESYQEKRSPYYDALSVAEKLAEFWHIPLIAISGTPRVETWYKSQNGEYETYQWGATSEKTKVSVIDMKNERRKGNCSLFAELSLQKIAAALSKNEQVLLFMNRKGEASALLCRDCGMVLRCEICSSPLTVHTGNTLHCHRCKAKKEMPRACVQCGNVNLKSLGAGTEMVEKEIKKIFAKASVIRLDREIIGSKRNAGIDEKTLQKADIIVATQMIDKPLSLPRLSVSIAVMPDSFFHYPHFRAEERVFQLLHHMQNLTNVQGILLLQTFAPEHRLFEYIAQNRKADFYNDELSTRKSLSLPPFMASPGSV